MRKLVTALAFALAGGGGLASPAVAADLGATDPSYYCNAEKPKYFGVYEPWSRSSERPPRKGVYFYTNPAPPAVNFLVPMNGNHCVRPTPWTAAWYDYCAKRWPSFNPKTGTIRTPDGIRMCI